MPLPPRIPRVLHVYWEGRLSFLRLMTLVSFRQMNPGIKIILYTAEPRCAMQWSTLEQSVPYTGTDYLAELHEFRAVDEVVRIDCMDWWGRDDLPANVRADLCRATVLAEQGGIWSDMDIIWLKPVGQIAGTMYPSGWSPQSLDFATVFRCGEAGVMLSAPGTAYFKRIKELALKNVDRQQYQSAGPVTFLECGAPAAIMHTYPELRFCDIEPMCFYPINWNEPEKLVSENVPLPSETVGLHWFGGNPVVERYLNTIECPADLYAASNTIGAALRRLRDGGAAR